MKGRKIKMTLWTVAALVTILVANVAWYATSGLRKPVQVPEPDYWPTDGWRASTPEEQGYSSQKLAEGLQEMQDEGLAIDSLLIIHNGYVVLDAHFSPMTAPFHTTWRR